MYIVPKSTHESRRITAPEPVRGQTNGCDTKKTSKHFTLTTYEVHICVILTLRRREAISMWPLATASCSAEPSSVRLLMSQPASSNKLQPHYTHRHCVNPSLCVSVWQVWNIRSSPGLLFADTYTYVCYNFCHTQVLRFFIRAIYYLFIRFLMFVNLF